MESNAWLVFVIAGLMLDIAGIIIIVGPQLRYKLTGIEEVGRRREESKKEWKELDKKIKNMSQSDIKKLTDNPINEYSLIQLNKELLRIETIALSSFENELGGRYDAKSAIIFGIVVISSGFILQMIGNFMK